MPAPVLVNGVPLLKSGLPALATEPCVCCGVEPNDPPRCIFSTLADAQAFAAAVPRFVLRVDHAATGYPWNQFGPQTVVQIDPVDTQTITNTNFPRWSCFSSPQLIDNHPALPIYNCDLLTDDAIFTDTVLILSLFGGFAMRYYGYTGIEYKLCRDNFSGETEGFGYYFEVAVNLASSGSGFPIPGRCRVSWALRAARTASTQYANREFGPPGTNYLSGQFDIQDTDFIGELAAYEIPLASAFLTDAASCHFSPQGDTTQYDISA